MLRQVETGHSWKNTIQVCREAGWIYGPALLCACIQSTIRASIPCLSLLRFGVWEWPIPGSRYHNGRHIISSSRAPTKAAVCSHYDSSPLRRCLTTATRSVGRRVSRTCCCRHQSKLMMTAMHRPAQNSWQRCTLVMAQETAIRAGASPEL